MRDARGEDAHTVVDLKGRPQAVGGRVDQHQPGLLIDPGRDDDGGVAVLARPHHQLGLRPGLREPTGLRVSLYSCSRDSP